MRNKVLTPAAAEALLALKSVVSSNAHVLGWMGQWGRIVVKLVEQLEVKASKGYLDQNLLTLLVYSLGRLKPKGRKTRAVLQEINRLVKLLS